MQRRVRQRIVQWLIVKRRSTRLPFSRDNTRDVSISLLILLVTWSCHSASRVRTSTDSRWTVPTALNLIDHGTSRLDNYALLIKQNEFYAVLCVGIDKKVIQPLSSLDQCRDGHLYNFFPIGVALLAAPEVYVIRKGAWIASAFPWLARRVKNPYRRQLL